MASGDADLPHLVFLYGTYKPGEKRAHLLEDQTDGLVSYVGRAVTANKYPLVVLTEWNFPFLLDIPGEGHHVQGAVYRIDDKRLAWCDANELIPLVYERDKISVNLLSTGMDDSVHEGPLVECWCYFFRKYNGSHLRAPRYASYSHTVTPYSWPSRDFDDIDEFLQILGISKD